VKRATPTDFCPRSPRLLAGGVQSLRLAARAAVMVAAVAGLCAGLPRLAEWWMIGSGTAGLIGLLVETAVAVAVALAVAALASRWLGAHTGLLAGVVMAGFLYAPWDRPGVADQLARLAVLGAMGAFSLANLPGPLPLKDGRLVRLGFFVCVNASIWLVGLAAPLAVGAACVLYLLTSSDSRGARFFAEPLGLLMLGCSVVGWTARWAGWWGPLVAADPQVSFVGAIAQGTLGTRLVQTAMGLGWTTLPFTPLIAAAVLVGLRNGHHASLFWRMVGCWAAVPLVLTLVLPGQTNVLLGWTLPPLAIVGGAGLQGCLVRVRCRRSQCAGPGAESQKPAGARDPVPYPASAALQDRKQSAA